jgi:hypothetical protein
MWVVALFLTFFLLIVGGKLDERLTHQLPIQTEGSE